MASSHSSKPPRKVIVTGARTGIGLGIALAFLRNHDQVVLVSRAIDIDGLSESKDELERFVASRQAFLLQKDVSDVNECRSLMQSAVKALGGQLDVLVNNAGGGTVGVPFEEVTPESWREHFALNLDSVFYLTQEAVPHLRKTQGCVVNISSIGGLRPAQFMLPYSCAKAALDALTKSTAVAFAEEGIRINSINPGLVDTPIFEHSGMDEQQREEILKQGSEGYPLKRVGKPSDVASLALFLADNRAASWLTGQLIVLDGGKLIGQ